MELRRVVRRAFHSAGIEIRTFSPESSEFAGLCRMLSANGVDVVFDIGASDGYFASHLLDAGYKGRIISFEPLSRSHQKLVLCASEQPRWIIAPPMAIGSGEGEVQMNISGNVGSSSILPMLDRHVAAAPNSRYIEKETVCIMPLDKIFSEYATPNESFFLKIDVQGYETEVFRGAQEALMRAAGLQIELSFEPLYEGQALFRETFDRITKLGFEPWAFTPSFVEVATGRMLQVDGVFFRPGVTARLHN